MSTLNAPLITFLEVARLGSLRRAADVLSVTQAAVTMRIKTLEASLGFPLLVRDHSGASLTEPGSRFLAYAQTAVTAIAQGKEAARRASAFRAHVRFMSQFLLLETVALDWASWMRAEAPDISVSIDSGYSEHAVDYMAAGLLDLAIGYQEKRVPGMVFEQLFTERLILATSCDNIAEWRTNYIPIEWDDAFSEAHREQFGDLGARSPLHAPFAEAARLLMMRTPASAYVVERVARPQLEAGTLRRVREGRDFERPAYAVYPSKPARPDIQDKALSGLRYIAASLSSKNSKDLALRHRTPRRRARRN